MKEKNRNKDIYTSIPEGCNHRSQPCKKMAETLESCGGQLRGRKAYGTRGWSHIRSILRSLCSRFQPLFSKQQKRLRSIGLRLVLTLRQNAFTLIELVVVALIIGILAAIAVPQYEKAVEKSHAVQALTMLKAIGLSGERYFMANGVYPSTFADMDIEIPWTGKHAWFNEFQDVRSNVDWSAVIQNKSSGVSLGRISGPYKGAGFYYYWQSATPGKKHSIACVERINNGDIFMKKSGDFCEKLFLGYNKVLSGGINSWTLPN